jgi:hypothetical protein
MATSDEHNSADRFGRLRSTRSKAVSFIVAALSFTIFVSELTKFLKISPHLLDYLYLILLASVGVKVVTWILISEMELDILCDWLDPKDYQPPNETATILLLAVTLTALVLAAKYLFLFGIIYVLYAIGNLFGWWRLRLELRVAISRTRLRQEEDLTKAEIRTRALNAMEAYYLTFPHMLRSWIVLVAAIVPLLIAIYAKVQPNQLFGTVGYGIYIFDILVVEEATIMFSRSAFYTAMRPISAAEYERKRLESVPQKIKT